ncbi:MAG: PIG-L deacetylase family protein [Chloroflexota bacterium]
MTENGVPKSAMVIVAHPDDAEFTVAGTVAAWTRAGCRVTYVVCTDGNAGSHEPGMTPPRLAEIRRAEQRAACAVLGVEEVLFLGYDDGQLQPTLELRRDLVRAIRRYKPEAVLTGDPTVLFAGNEYINHPDHRAAAQAALDAVAPASAMPLLWPEAGQPHRVRRVYVYFSAESNVWVDVSETIDTKIEALRQHASQMGDWHPGEMIREWAAETGKEKGIALAESYRVITLLDSETVD